MLTIFIIFSTSIALAQFEPGTQTTPQKQEDILVAKDSIFQPIPSGYWLKFNAFKTVSIIIVLIAFIYGFISYFQGMSAGGKLNRKEIRKSIILALIVAIFARPVPIMIHHYIGIGLNYFLPEAYAFGIAEFIVYILWMTYIIAIPVFLYESFTVSAKEAYPVGGRH